MGALTAKANRKEIRGEKEKAASKRKPEAAGSYLVFAGEDSLCGDGGNCPLSFCESSSAALCRATSTSNWKLLKSSPKSSGGVGGGVLKSPLVGLEASARVRRASVLPVALSCDCLVWDSSSIRCSMDRFSRSPVITVKLPASGREVWQITGGHTDMERTLDVVAAAAAAGGTIKSPEPAAAPRETATSLALVPRREIVNWFGSLPSFSSISGRSRRLALMNQLQIWKKNIKRVALGIPEVG